MKSKTKFVSILIVLLTLACGHKEVEFSPAAEAPREMQMVSKMAAPMMADSEVISEIGVERKMIRTANLRIEVPKFKEAAKTVENIVTEVGGYVSNSNSQEDNDQKLSGTLSLRIPEKSFQQVLEKLRLVGKLKEENIQGDDITEEYVDLEIRLKNKQELENRLLEILKKQTNKLSDLLEVEREIARVREEIERMEGRKRFLDDQVQLATISVHLFEPTPLASSSQWGPLGRAVKEIVRVFANSVGTLMLVLVSVLPWAILAIILGWIGLTIIRRRRRTTSPE